MDKVFIDLVVNSTHILKLSDEYFDDVQDEVKTFELRFNDRNYQVGDVVIFKEISLSGYSGRSTMHEITYILKDVPLYGLDKDHVIFGIEKVI